MKNYDLRMDKNDTYSIETEPGPRDERGNERKTDRAKNGSKNIGNVVNLFKNYDAESEIITRCQTAAITMLRFNFLLE